MFLGGLKQLGKIPMQIPMQFMVNMMNLEQFSVQNESTYVNVRGLAAPVDVYGCRVFPSAERPMPKRIT